MARATSKKVIWQRGMGYILLQKMEIRVFKLVVIDIISIHLVTQALDCTPMIGQVGLVLPRKDGGVIHYSPD